MRGHLCISDVLAQLVDSHIHCISKHKPQIYLPLFDGNTEHSNHYPDPFGFEIDIDLDWTCEWQCSFCLQYIEANSFECPHCD